MYTFFEPYYQNRSITMIPQSYSEISAVIIFLFEKSILDKNELKYKKNRVIFIPRCVE